MTYAGKSKQSSAQADLALLNGLGCSSDDYLARADLHGRRFPESVFIDQLVPADPASCNVVSDTPAIRSQTIVINWGTGQGFFGPCLVAWTEQGICRLDLDAGPKSVTDMHSDWPAATFERDDTGAQNYLERIAAGDHAGLQLHLTGTDFQVSVWRALLAIPSGYCMTYRGLATCLGRPAAARAVGSAIARNPIAVLVPCHRVLPANGLPGEYRWGSVRKRALLLREQLTDKGLSQQVA